MAKTYDRAYFEKWYRDPRHAVSSRHELERKVALAVAMAEYYLGREVRCVLDVGCGEAPWRAPLKRLRPKLDYLGLDASEYAVARYGRTRNLRLAKFGDLEHLRFAHAFDLIVCADTLHYIRADELRRGLRGLVEMLDGVAFIELFAREDAPEGDRHGYLARPARWYLREFRAAGLLPCGTHCYLGSRLRNRTAALETNAAG